MRCMQEAWYVFVCVCGGGGVGGGGGGGGVSDPDFLTMCHLIF